MRLTTPRLILAFGMSAVALVVGGFAAALNLSAEELLWRADIQVQSLRVTRLDANLLARIVVYSDNDDEARAARVEILVPVGVGIVRMAEGCTASAGPPGISVLRARVTCELGTLPVRGNREVFVMTTMPPSGIPRAFGAFAMSDTPDPKPGNNFAERMLR
jgi:hypothetical protein